VFKFGTCIDPNFHFESGHPQVTKEPVLHLENLSNLTLGFLGEPSGKAERTPNPSDSFASKEFIFFESAIYASLQLSWHQKVTKKSQETSPVLRTPSPKERAKRKSVFPTSLKKLTLDGWNPPNSSLRSSNKEYFYAVCTCFLAHRTRSRTGKL